MTRVRVWIDAASGRADTRVYGMTLVERLLRMLVSAPAELAEVRVEIAAGDRLSGWAPAELLERLPTKEATASDAPLAARVETALREGGGPLLVLSADQVVDERLLHHLLAVEGTCAFLSGEGEQRGAALRLDPEVSGGELSGDDLCALAESALATGRAAPFDPAAFDGYIGKLRRELPAYLFRIRDEKSRREVERFLFWSNYKGSTDFMTKYVYPPVVWLMVPPLADRRVHPNWVTAVDIVATFAAIPFFMAGMWAPGLFLAYLMSVLDSVDGKLARLTFTSSKLGNVLDHGLDIVHPPFWYLAWGYALGGQSIASTAWKASVFMFGMYVADRILAAVFKRRTGRSIHGYTPTDERMRTFISRRNVNLPLFTAAVVVDALVPGVQAALFTFYGIIAWQVASFVFHADRVLRFWSRPAQEQAMAARGAVEAS